jgi:hypothetical protein
MNNLLKASLLALPLLAVPTRAQAWCCWDWLPLKIDHGFEIRSSWHFNLGGCSSPCAGPWYSYWPYEAHFQVGAPVGGWGCNYGGLGCNYPYWPASGGVAGSISYGTPVMAAQQPAMPSQAQPAAGFQPAGYYSQTPSYWYGR